MKYEVILLILSQHKKEAAFASSLPMLWGMLAWPLHDFPERHASGVLEGFPVTTWRQEFQNIQYWI